jgi:hypothetical protein
MKELDSVSTHLKEMLLHDDWSSAAAGVSSADSVLCNNGSIDSSYLNTDNSAPRALIAYAGAFLIFQKRLCCTYVLANVQTAWWRRTITLQSCNSLTAMSSQKEMTVIMILL